MPTYIRSGSKVSVFASPKQLAILSAKLGVVIYVGNEFVASHVSVAAKLLPLIQKLLGG